MKNKLFFLILILLSSLLNAVTIYQIQYTTNAGTGTYPSPYANQAITTTGVVTALGYSSSRGFHISMPEGGAWKGILVYTTAFSPALGDLVQVTGQVYEYNGLTEIQTVTAYQILSTGNTIPAPTVLTTAQFSNEAYEGVLVKVQNATCTQVVNASGEWAVSDGSGNCVIKGYIFNQNLLGTQVTLGNQFSSIIGIGHYSYGFYNLNPRTLDDVVLANQPISISLPTLQTNLNTQVAVAITVSNLTLAQNLQNYQFQLGYNPSVLSYTGYGNTGTLSSGGTVQVTPTGASLSVNFSTTGYLQGQGTLLNLNFNSISGGTSSLTASAFTFSGTPVSTITQGNVTVSAIYAEVIDTLTVIQRPLINIPAIVIPGETFDIECVASPATTGWAAWLYKDNLDYSLTITNSQYAASPPRWVLTAQVPNINVFELYNLRVTANGGINDRTKHSVQVLPTRKTSYYFAQVTDVHMPTHILSPATGYDTDSTETVDFREVINDINLIRPEFVLLTGDLVNEGELEDYNNVREMTKGKRLLGEFEVPVYLIAGNHDISGWQTTPPPAGTSRKNWWKNFGWSWLNNSSDVWQYHTQDYSFDYGPVHYIGMEGYNNSGSYDNYLPAIYGSDSYTATQMQWLQADLAATSATTKVLFQHYDFSSQINLTTLGLTMSLGGHTHTNSGSLTTTPYSLLTDNVCDGARAYRIVKVNGTTLQPFATVNAGTTGANISISYSPGNYGYADSVSAVLVNNQAIGYENALVKFIMPDGDAEYTVTGGALEQVDTSGSFNICYVKANLAASSSVTVTIKAIVTSIPLSPTNLTLINTGTARVISWQPVTHNTSGTHITISSYTIEASADPYSGFTYLDTTTSTQYSDPDTSFPQRFYRVKALTGSR